MKIEIWMILVVVFILFYLIMRIIADNKEIKRITSESQSEKEAINDEIMKLTLQVSKGEITQKKCNDKTLEKFRNEIQRQFTYSEDRYNDLNKKYNKLEELRNEIQKQFTNAEVEYNDLRTKYSKLIRAYMLARRKAEIDVVREIEQSIYQDYEELNTKNLLLTEYVASMMADYYTSSIKDNENVLSEMGYICRSDRIADLRKFTAELIQRSKRYQYTYEILLLKIQKDYPEINLAELFSKYDMPYDDIASGIKMLFEEQQEYEKQEAAIREYNIEKERYRELSSEYEEKIRLIQNFDTYISKRLPLLKESIEDYQHEYQSNLTAIPFMSRIIADIMTIDFDRLIWSLSWGNNQERQKKVASLNALKKEKADEIERIKGAEYQLAYLLELYPALQDVIDTEFKDLEISYDDVLDSDPVNNYIEREEWNNLSESERNQLALNRYIESRKKSKWQIGRDYELYCGYCYEQKGYKVDYYGSYHGLEDLGRDLIVVNGNDIRIIQCKYWSQEKEIHEKHIMQLFGTLVEYNMENNANAKGILITNTKLSNKAKEFAKVLGISYRERFLIGEFPRIKCNIGNGETGNTKIYHLPFDQQYDTTKVDKDGEFMAFTVAEAENAGFRRAYRWHGLE